MDKLKNWKTNLAFFLFLICFCYAVYKENVALVEATGFITVIAWALLKASSETFNTVVTNISEYFKGKKNV